MSDHTLTADGLRKRYGDVNALDVPEPTTFAGTARAIGRAGGRAVYVGYSMGGRLFLRLAIDHHALTSSVEVIRRALEKLEALTPWRARDVSPSAA